MFVKFPRLIFSSEANELQNIKFQIIWELNVDNFWQWIKACALFVLLKFKAMYARIVKQLFLMLRIFVGAHLS